MLDSQNNKIISQQILRLLNTNLHQNYFTFANKIYQLTTGIAMVSPLSNDITEIFLQHHEQRLLKHLMENNTIEFYTRYVDDIFIIYNTEQTNMETINHYINSINPNLTFTPTQETHKTISFLDLQITRKNNAFDINIYRKPTTTDTTINYNSNHPIEQNLAAYKFLINRMISLPLTQTNQNIEWSKILKIAQNNNFPTQLIHKLKTKTINQQKTNVTKQTNNLQWTTFTYFIPKIRKITNIFKDSKLNIAFRTTNTIADKTKSKNNQDTDNPVDSTHHNKSGIYQLTCRTCDKSYIGQTNRNIAVRYSEHSRYIRTNNPQSAYAEHILKNRHEYSSLLNIMKLIKHINRPSKLIPFEQLII